jgi:anti-sigma B factor antagonist
MTPAPHGLAIETDQQGDQVVVRVKGELDLSTTPQLSAALDDAATATPSTVVLDLGGVSFIDSSALRVLVMAGRSLADGGRTLQIGPRSEMVARLLTMTSLDRGGDAFQVLPEQG